MRVTAGCHPSESTSGTSDAPGAAMPTTTTPPDRPEAAVFIATSLDGYIARPDGSIDWLHVPGGEGDYGYADFMAGVDALILGRKTYEQVLTFGKWPYGNTRVIVLSSGSLDMPAEGSARVEVLNLEPEPLLRRLGAEGVRRAYVDGGETIQRFLRAGLIDELIVSRIPILIGEGRPLFGPLPHDVELEHVETRSFDNGLVQSRYRVA